MILKHKKHKKTQKNKKHKKIKNKNERQDNEKRAYCDSNASRRMSSQFCFEVRQDIHYPIGPHVNRIQKRFLSS